MDRRNRNGQIVIEALLLALFFTAIILIYQVKTQQHVLQQKKFRWEKKND